MSGPGDITLKPAPAALGTKPTNIQTVRCPHCGDPGYTFAGLPDHIVDRLHQFDEPRSCQSCGKWMKFHIRITVTADKLDIGG